jgi:hypothetical protein
MALLWRGTIAFLSLNQGRGFWSCTSAASVVVASNVSSITYSAEGARVWNCSQCRSCRARTCYSLNNAARPTRAQLCDFCLFRAPGHFASSDSAAIPAVVCVLFQPAVLEHSQASPNVGNYLCARDWSCFQHICRSVYLCLWTSQLLLLPRIQ